ncbi:MAG: hypothetical protein AAF493_14380, partial [Pseudomonadota bacterium]
MRGANATLDLEFPAQVVIWTLRTGAESGFDRTLPCLIRTFGKTDGKILHHAFFDLLSTVGTAGIGARFALDLTRVEVAVLAAIRTVQRGSALKFVPPNLSRDLQDRFTQSVETIARILLAVGYAVELPPGRVPAPEVSHSFLLEAIRKWVQALQADRAPDAAVHPLFTTHGVGEAARSLDTLMRNIALTATRDVDVRCPQCKSVSPDEDRILSAVGALESVGPSRSVELLMDMVPAAAARLSLPALSELSDAVKRAADDCTRCDFFRF